MKPSKRVYDAEAANPVVVSQPPLAGKGYTTGGAPQTVAAPAGASLGTVQPVPVQTSKPSTPFMFGSSCALSEKHQLSSCASSHTLLWLPVGKFGRFRKTGKPTAATSLPTTGTSTVITQSTTTAVAPIATETTTAPSYAPNYGGVVAGSELDSNAGKGAWASRGGMAGGNGTTVV